MKRYWLIFGLILAFPTYAGTVCDQGSGSGAVRPWYVTTSSTNSAGATSECVVSNTVATTCPATPLAGRTGIELYNNGLRNIYCTIDGSTPVVNKARPIVPQSAWSFPGGAAVTVKCIADTVAQTTGSATIVSEVR
jgi:hypothetical protein